MASTDRIQGLRGDLALKTPCRVATTAAITLEGLQTIDGVALASGDRVLVKNQATTTENGIYTASTGTWLRAYDFNGIDDVVNGTTTRITEGTVSAGLFYSVSATDPVTPGSTAIAFTDSALVAPSVAAAEAYASAASASASAAASSAGTASSAAADVVSYASAAGVSASAASSSAAAAAGYLAPVTSTYAGALTIAGTGDQSFTVETGENFVPGHPVKIAKTSDPVNYYMLGTVKSYNSGTGALVVTVASAVGSGAQTGWTVSLTPGTTATSATNLAAGSAGTLPYQSGAGTTAMLAAGTSGDILTSGGAGAPTWTAQSGLAVGSAANVTGAAADGVTGTTQAWGDNSTKLATTAYADRLRSVPSNSQADNYTLVLGDMGKSIDMTVGGKTVTIPANASVAFDVGTVIGIDNMASTSISIAITSDTLRMSGTTSTGTRTLAGYGQATLRKVSSTVWKISGAGLS